MTNIQQQKSDLGKGDKDLEIEVKSTLGVYGLTVPKTTTVQGVIDKARDYFGFAENGNYKLRLDRTGEYLAPNRPLVSYGVIDNDVLTLVDHGIAV